MGALSFGPFPENSLWKDYADDKPRSHQAVTIYPRGSCCVNGRQEKPRGIGLQERAAIYLFIFLLGYLIPKTGPCSGKQEYKRTRGILQNSNWGTVDLIGVHLADNGEGSPAGWGRDPGNTALQEAHTLWGLIVS